MNQSEEEYKITIKLSRKGLATLDNLKEQSGFGSRGRTIEEAVLAVSDIREWLGVYAQVMSQTIKEGKTADPNMMSSIWIQVIQVISRFGRIS